MKKYRANTFMHGYYRIIPITTSLLIVLLLLFSGCKNEPTNIIISFDAQGGTIASPANKVVSYKSTYGSLGMTTREGYIFDGWWTGEDGTGIEVTTATTVATESNHTLYAKWIAGRYTVIFDVQGGENLSAVSKTVTTGTSYGQLATTSKIGQTFSGWWTGPEGSGVLITSDSLVQIGGFQTLYAHWVNGYTITFDSNGGSAPNPAYKAVKFDTAFGALAASSREGYTFDGWYSGIGGTGEKILPTSVLQIAESQTLYSKWIANTYTVSFDAQGGENSVPPTKDVTHASTYGALASVSRDGFTFDGWWIAPDGGGTQITVDDFVSITTDQTLYAKWIPNSYSVTFAAQGGVNLNPASKIVKTGKTYGELASTIKAGHTFLGWFTEPEGEGTEVLSGTIVTINADHTLYALWQGNTQTITFDAQGGFYDGSDSKVVTYGRQYGQLPEPTWENHTFDGWWTGEGGIGSEVTEETVFARMTDLTLYAKWIFDVYTGFAGGLVFYENPKWKTDGWRYLEAAPNGWYKGTTDSYGEYSGEYDPSFQWGAGGYEIDPSARATGVGSGAINTDNIVSYHDSLWSLYPEKEDYYNNPTAYCEYNDGTVAAKVCADYSVEKDGTTYDDWFLPSKDELNLIYITLYEQGLGGFSGSFYWSSSDYHSYAAYAWSQTFFFNGDQAYSYNRFTNLHVRPVRAF